MAGRESVSSIYATDSTPGDGSGTEAATKSVSDPISRTADQPCATAAGAQPGKALQAEGTATLAVGHTPMSTNAGSLRRTRPGVPSSTQLRVARATPNIKALLPFYCDGLGFEVVSSFVDHEDFDGIMLALPGTSSYHLEFTCTTRGLAEEQLRPPSPESLLVFYLPDDINYQYACDRMQRLGFAPVKSFNPYWDRCGKTFEDPDGYRMVLANADWKPDA